MTQKEYIARFTGVCQEMINLTTSKNADYASPEDAFRNFNDFGVLGILVRMSDKFSRLRTALVDRRRLRVESEKVGDTLLDLAVYTIILKIYLEATPSCADCGAIMIPGQTFRCENCGSTSGSS